MFTDNKSAAAVDDILIRPRLLEYHGILASQNSLSFAIPFLNEDIPLYIDPFLMWSSPSQQDQSLHAALIAAFNSLGQLAAKGKTDEAIGRLCRISECHEVGLGNSATRNGKRIGKNQARQILDLFLKLPHFKSFECRHLEETQLYIAGVSKDRISDITCNLIKSFLIDFTIDECSKLGIPLEDCIISDVFSSRDHKFNDTFKAKLPKNPTTNEHIIFVPKRWLRHVPWINYDEYFKSYCPQDDVSHAGEKLEHVEVLQYNLSNYGVVENYVKEKERTFQDCKSDPLFEPIPVISAKRQYKRLEKLPSGKENNADKLYEDIIEALLPSVLYPHLDFATAQSRTESGVSIRDLVFYNNRDHPFLLELFNDFNARQIVFELKNVKEVEREHIDQINRYLAPGIGSFGVIVTRNSLTKARLKQTIDLWSGQRKTIIALTDQDIKTMVEIFDSKQRLPLDVIKKKFFEFRQSCPV